MFTNFIYDVQALVLLLLRVLIWRYYIPFMNTRTKSEAGERS